MVSSRNNNFHPGRFRKTVDKALESVAQILEVHRKPQLAEYVDHDYDDKYTMVESLSNVAIISQINVLAGLGLTAEVLNKLSSNNNRSSVTLRFQATESVELLKTEKVRVGSGTEMEVETTGSGVRRSLLSRIVKRVKEYHWRVSTEWEISLYLGTSVDDRTVLTSRSVARKIKTQSDRPRFSKANEYAPLDVSLDFLLHNIEEETAEFQIDRGASKTPRRNGQVESMVIGMDALADWAGEVVNHFDRNIVRRFVCEHNPVHNKPGDTECISKFQILANNRTDVFSPIQPLLEERKERSFVKVTAPVAGDMVPGPSNRMVLALPDTKETETEEESPVLSYEDYFLMLEQQVRSLEEKLGAQQESFPKKDTKKLISQAEAEAALYILHAKELASGYLQAVDYVEHLLRTQLTSAIGKEIGQSDIDKFVKYNNSKLLVIPPQPFCHVVRRPEHSPEGILSIEGIAGDAGEFEPIQTFARVSDCESINVPLDAAASAELKGRVMLHGWLRHPFHGTNDQYQLTARARQFSCFVVMVGTMASGSEFQPKDALIVRNKDEIMIPLLLEDIPSPKEFKDAIRSLSPEQQRFAKAFRSMQLGSSVFGVCVVQIKPQLETLLGLPVDSLTKEMQLTEDLMELFIEHQIPSDMLSFDCDEAEEGALTTVAMVDKVKGHVESIVAIIANTKKKQLSGNIENALLCSAPVGKITAQNESVVVRREISIPSLAARSIGRELDRARCQEEWDVQLDEIGEGLQDLAEIRLSGFLEEEPYALECYTPDMAPAEYEREGEWAYDPDGWDAGYERAVPVDVESVDNRRSRGLEAYGSGDVFYQLEEDNTKAFTAQPEGAHQQNRQVDGASERTRDEVHDSGSNPEKTGRDVAKVDFTAIPKRVNEAFEVMDKTGSLRSCTIKSGKDWRRKRQENLLTRAVESTLDVDGLKSETNKALDLLDALSRSGTLPIVASELHVVVAASHRFENDVMGTVIEDNINPIEKLEKSILTFASSVHGVHPGSLVRDPIRSRQLAVECPSLFGVTTD